MADQFRFRSGQMELVSLGVASATVIERNDMLFFSTSANQVSPASDHNWGGGLTDAQSSFANVFAGIAYEASASGDTDDISVDTSPNSVYEFDVASATYDYGDDLGPDNSDSAILLDDQQLEAVSSSANAVARSQETKTSAVTLLKVKFASAFNVSANNANSVVG